MNTKRNRYPDFKLWFYSCLFVTILFLGVVSFLSADSFRIAAVVNNEVITEGEVKELMGPKGDFSSALDYLIAETLLSQEAKREQIKVDKGRMEEEFKKIKERFPSEKDFYRQLQKENLRAHQLKKNLEKQLSIQKLIRKKVLGRVSVTPDEVEKEFSKKDFSSKRSYYLTEIYRKDKKGIDKIFRQIKEGKVKFAKFATNLGYFQKQELAPEFQAILPELKVGEVSKPIKRKDGYYLLSIIKEKEDKKDPEKVREAIRQELFQKKFKQRYEKFIAELRKNAYIEIKNNE